jgi:hypothetical protein
MAKRWGEDSNVYKVRVLGEFPASEDDVVIPMDMIESAVGREVALIPNSPQIWGVDVARFGSDHSALAKRFGNHVPEKVVTWRGLDTMALTGRIYNIWQDSPAKPDAIHVDTIGIGAGVYDRLRELGLPVYGVNVAESASYKDRYMRLRDELWFMAREWFETASVKMVDDPDLIGELALPKFEITSAGKRKVESKDEMKKRVPHSPDRADALCLTFLPRRIHRKPLTYDYRGIV